MSNNPGRLYLCGGCSRKKKKAENKIGEYYCEVAKKNLSMNVVTEDTDASECVEKGLFIGRKE